MPVRILIDLLPKSIQLKLKYIAKHRETVIWNGEKKKKNLECPAVAEAIAADIIHGTLFFTVMINRWLSVTWSLWLEET